MRARRFIGLLVLAGAAASLAWGQFEEEQLALETQLQQRIESILSKTLPANSYIVTVKVEMAENAKPTSVRSTGGGRRGGNNPFLDQNRFVLPGVPQKKEFVTQPDAAPSETVVNAFSSETMVRRILITILVSPDFTPEQIRDIRDVLSASIPFNPLRGDTLEIQNSALLKKATSPSAVTAVAEPAAEKPANFLSGLWDRTTAPFLILLIAVAIALVIFIIFLFGPVRAFLNRLLAVLPRIGEQAAYTVTNAPAKANVSQPGAAGGEGGSHGRNTFNGNGHPDSSDMPFRFIQEEQLNKLPILFRQMAAPQAALVLAYLPPEWASRVLGTMDPGAQSAIMRELSQAREVPAEAVKEVEAQLKAKLPYLVGGVDWIQSVYQLTQPQTQRTLLGTLNQQSPELAQALRRKTFFFEDINVIHPGGLRLLVQELGYPSVALCLKDEKPEFREAIMRKLPAGTREIIQQELDLSGEDRAAMADAKVRMVTLARRLLAEGRISLPERK